jgi:hypothetical protein
LKGIDALEEKFHEAIFKDLGMNKLSSELVSTIISKMEVNECIKNLKNWVKFLENILFNFK